MSLAAGASHAGVRYACGGGRVVSLLLAAVLLAWSVHLGRAPGGFWPGVYTMLTAYFLACMAMPWLDLAIRRLGRPVADKFRAG